MNDETDNNEEAPAAFLGSSAGCRTMADGTLRITVDLPPIHAIGAFTAFGAPGSPVAIARITSEVALEEGRPKSDKPVKGPYGEYAKALVQSGFFRVPNVWCAIGTDGQYLEWVKRQKSAISGEFSEYHDDGEAYCIPAHVRRVAHGSGTAIKPPYSAIPLTNQEHQQAHQHGDSNLRPDEWWDKTRIQYVARWAYETLKHNLRYGSYTSIPPSKLVEWASQYNVTEYLPRSIKDGANAEDPAESES
ncbi:MAG: hypothetical protein ACI9GW_001985 [Halieaceae bacterium]|jgi:hypothetical protein